MLIQVIKYIWYIFQINVETQRGFVPVDERMRVIDAKGKLVSDEVLYLSGAFGNMCALLMPYFQ